MHSLLLLFLVGSNLQNNFHQDNLSFVCLQLYKHNCLNILVGNVLSYTSIESIEMNINY